VDVAYSFYSASALQTVVIARPILSIRPSVIFRCYVQRNEDMIMRFSALGKTIIRVSGEVKFIQIFAGVIPSEGVKVRHSPLASENLTNNQS